MPDINASALVAQNSSERRLNDRHYKELVETRGLSADWVRANCWSVSAKEASESLGYTAKSDGIMFQGNGWQMQFKPDKPWKQSKEEKKKAPKYRSPLDNYDATLPTHPDNPTYWHDIEELKKSCWHENGKPYILITEGHLKAIAGCSNGIPTIALAGVEMGLTSSKADPQGKRYLVATLEKLAKAGFNFIFAFDADCADNEQVSWAEKKLGYQLMRFGVEVLSITGEWRVEEGKGMDDFIQANGIEEFRKRLEGACWVHDEDEKKETKTPSKLFKKYIAVKEAFASSLKLNELNQNIELDGKPLDFNTITLLLAEVTGEDFNQQQAESCVLRCAKENSYCPVRDYLNQVHEQHKGKYISLDNLSNELLGTEKEIENIYLKKALIAAVARIFQPGCKADTAYILQGDQGIRKSSFINVLAGEEWFSDTLNEGKDQYLHLHRYWIHEWSELENVTGKREISKVKALLSSPKDSFRPPYGRNIVEYPRKSVIWGTTNKTEFLSDPTGERRYWVSQLPKKRIDIKRVEGMRDVIWASAVDAYKKGEIHWLTPEEQKISDELNKNFKETDLWQDAIEKYLESRDFVRIPEILEEVCGVDVAHMCKLHDKRVADILKQLDWERKSVKQAGRTVKAWVQKKTTELVTELVTSQNPANPTVSADNNSPVTSYQLFLKTSGEKNESGESSEENSNISSTDLAGELVTNSQDIDSVSDSAVTSSGLPGNPKIEVGSKVGKRKNGRKLTGWVGTVRTMSESDSNGCWVWWHGDYDKTKTGKVIKNTDGTQREKLTYEKMSHLILKDS